MAERTTQAEYVWGEAHLWLRDDCSLDMVSATCASSERKFRSCQSGGMILHYSVRTVRVQREKLFHTLVVRAHPPGIAVNLI